MRRIPVWLAILAALLLALVAPAQARHQTDPDEAFLLDIRTPKLQLDRTAQAFATPAGTCIELADLIDALNLAIRFSQDRQIAEGWAFDESRQVAIDRSRGEIRYGMFRAPLADNAVWDSPGGWCVVSPVLERWLGIHLDVDTANAVLTVSADGGLPIEAAFKRSQNAQRLSGPQLTRNSVLPSVALPYVAWRNPAVDIAVTADVNRGDTGAARARSRYEAFAAGEIGFLSADARLASDEQAIPQSFRLRLYRSDQRGRLLGPLHATEFSIGDVLSSSSPLVTGSVAGRGVRMTNQPLGTSDRADKVDFNGSVPTGWDVELYRNGELLRTSAGGSGGRYEFRDVDLRLGPNNFEIVQYGPQGQIRRERRSYQIGAQIPKRGETWWSFNIVDGKRDLFEFSRVPTARLVGGGWRMDAEVEHGIGPGSSMAFAMHSFCLSDDRRRTVGEASARAPVRGALAEIGIATDARNGAALRAQLLGEVKRTNFSLELVRNRGLTTERLDSQQRSSLQLSLDHPIRAGPASIPLRFDLRSLTYSSERRVEAQFRTGLMTRRISLGATVGATRVKPASGPAHIEGTAGLLFSGRIGNVRLRGETNFRLTPRATLDSSSVTANIPIGPRDELNATVGHNGRDGTSFAGASFSRDLGFASLVLNGRMGTRGSYAFGIGLQFSIGNNDRGRFGRLRSASQTSSGSIAVTAYRDENGDGVRQADEPAIPPPGLLVNQTAMERREDEQPKSVIVLDKLAPAVPVEIALDESSIDNPYDIPATPGVAAVPRAGLVTRVELGVVGTATVEGTLFLNGKEAPGEPIELVNARGEVAYRLRSEFDGFFSLERVRYGSYTVRLGRTGVDLLGHPVVVGSRSTTITLGRIELSSPALSMAR